MDSQNGRRGMVVSLDVEEYVKAADTFGFARVPGDDGPGELVQAFDEGMCWNVRWKRTGVYAHAPVSTRVHAPLYHSLLACPPARPPALPSHAAARPNRPCAGKLGSYYTGAYALYHLRVGANDTDKTALDLVLRDVRARMEGSTARASPSGDTRMISLRTPEPLRS